MSFRLLLTFLGLLTLLAWAEPSQDPKTTLVNFHRTQQQLARHWLNQRPSLESFEARVLKLYRPYLSKAALKYVQAKGPAPRTDLNEPDEDPGSQEDEMMVDVMAAMADAKMQITDLKVSGSRALLKATFSADGETIEEKYELVKEDGVWKVTTDTLKLFTI